MSYIKKTLSKDETILMFLRMHWFYFVPYILVSLWILPVIFISQNANGNTGETVWTWTARVGITLWIYAIVVYMSSEYAVTNRWHSRSF